MSRYFRLVSGVVFFLSLAQELAMPLDSESRSANLEVTSVETLREYIHGFPAYAAVTIAASPHTSFSHLRFANLLDLSGCIGIEITRPDGKAIVHHLPAPPPYEDTRSGGETLREGESRRMLADISQLIPADIPEGEYHARIMYAARRGDFYWSKLFNIKLRNPTAVEAGWLSSLAPDRQSALEWTDWTYTQPKYPVYLGEITPENPLKLNLILRRLFFGAQPLEQVDPELLSVLTGGNDSKLYEPETLALKAELYQARGDHLKYQECVTRISARTPGLQWWIRMMESGGGFLRTFRLGPVQGRGTGD
jgi:hypothetical protein